MTADDRFRRGDAPLVEALLVGASQREAALHAGLSERTVRRRLAEHAFRARLAEAEADLVRQVRRRIVANATGALNVLRTIANDENAPESVRAHAAGRLLQTFTTLQPMLVELTAEVGNRRPDAGPPLAKLRAFLAETARNGAAPVAFGRPTELPGNGDGG